MAGPCAPPLEAACARGRGRELAVRRREFRGSLEGSAHAARVSHRASSDGPVLRPEAVGKGAVQLRPRARRLLSRAGPRRWAEMSEMVLETRWRGRLSLGLLLAP